MRAKLNLCAVALAALTAGCGGGGSGTDTVPNPPEAPTVFFSAVPDVVSTGETATLTWSSRNATSCDASGDWTGNRATSGTELTNPLTSAATFSLSCAGPGGTTAQNATVNIVPTLEISASPDNVLFSHSTTVSWTSSNVTECNATGDWDGPRAISGTENTAALTKTSDYTNFVLTCNGPGGAIERTARVTVYPLPDPPQNMRAAYGDSSITVSLNSSAGYVLAGFPVTTNIYFSTSPNFDLENFDETPPNRVERLQAVTQPMVYRGFTNGTAYYVAAADEVSGILTAPTVEIGVTPQPVPPLIESIVALNDSGVTGCAEDRNLELPCPVSSMPNQDADLGRDAAARSGQLVKVGFGPAGFDLTKLGSNGDPLTDDAPAWQCIRDNVTGLIWQVPTDSGLTSVANRYTWYQPDPLQNGGYSGQSDGGSCTDSQCDTYAFIQALNSARLCGFQDWRLPTRRELFSLANFNSADPAMLGGAFPVLPSYFNAFFWSSTTDPGTASVGFSAWGKYVHGPNILSTPKPLLGAGRAGSIIAVRADPGP